MFWQNIKISRNSFTKRLRISIRFFNEERANQKKTQGIRNKIAHICGTLDKKPALKQF